MVVEYVASCTNFQFQCLFKINYIIKYLQFKSRLEFDCTNFPYDNNIKTQKQNAISHSIKVVSIYYTHYIINHKLKEKIK